MCPELPSGTVTFLFTDIEGSTRLLHTLGPEQYAKALAEHRRLLRESFAAHGGVEVDTQGVAVFVAFPTVPGAIASARDAQASLESGPIRVRMGLHTGTPIVGAEGYVGVDVHRGARVAALAHGGQVLLTEATASLIPQHETINDLGRHRLKDFDGPARLFQLGTDAHPPLRTPGTVLLPIPSTRFLGRERELYDAVSLVLTEAPSILTILGPGGTGKTRFAIELSRLIAEDADGGTFFVPLAALRDASLVVPSVADALGAEARSAEGIAARVGDRRTHLVLDNVEQLLPDVAAVLASLVEMTSSFRVLVTSREALNVSAETRFDLPPLVLEEASTFFIERARHVGAAPEPTETVRTLCERLDCLPLALELAAARTRLLTPDAILARLSERLDLPAQRDADPRHATLRATIQWSYDLLAPSERALFASLAIFRGGCTLEAAEGVCGADLDTLASLIDKSLVRRRVFDDGVERYWMLETLREFASLRLDELGERAETMRARHAHRMLALARSANLEAGLQPLAPRFEVVRPELEDIRAAIDWATEAEPSLAAELVAALEMLWPAQALAEGKQRTEALLERGTAVPASLRAALLAIHGGVMILLTSDQAAGEPSYHAAIALYRELGDVRGEARILMRLAVHAGVRGHADEARRLIALVRRMTGGLDLPELEAQSLSTLASLAENAGELEDAFALYQQSAEVAAACGFTLWETWQQTNVAEIGLRLGRYDAAEAAARVALDKAWTQGDRRIAFYALGLLALTALERGDPRRAGLLWGAIAEEDELGDILASDDELLRLIAPLRTSTEPELARGVELGRSSSLEAAVELGLGQARTKP
jgi:predicted ATPase/class 3 adenylate cyclase